MDELTKKLCSWLRGRAAVVVCIGTDTVSGDCLGPLVGQLLVDAGAPAHVYGTLQNPVSALNVDEINSFIRRKHPDSTVIAVDASVGSHEGRISLQKGAIIPGAADGKNLRSIGDISLTAVTCTAAPGKKEFALVRLGFVYGLAKSISHMLNTSLTQSLYYNKSPDFANNIGQKEIRV